MISIRKASHPDIPTLVDFQQRLAMESEGVELDAIILTNGMTALMNDINKGEYFLAEDDGKPVGCHMITYEWSDWRNGMVLWLQSVYVAESHRKNGVFKMMYSALTEKIDRDPAIIGLRLYVDKRNERAMKVYESMGMDGAHYTVFEWMKS